MLCSIWVINQHRSNDCARFIGIFTALLTSPPLISSSFFVNQTGVASLHWLWQLSLTFRWWKAVIQTSSQKGAPLRGVCGALSGLDAFRGLIGAVAKYATELPSGDPSPFFFTGPQTTDWCACPDGARWHHVRWKNVRWTNHSPGSLSRTPTAS